MQNKKCLNCNKEYETGKKYKIDFCSKECAREYSFNTNHKNLNKDKTCLICGKKFKNNESRTTHVNNYHCLTTKEYYDLFYREENEGICLYCGKETIFKNTYKGYNKYCNREHEKLYLQENFNVSNIAQRPDILNKIKSNNLKKYGVENVFAAKEFADKIRIGGCRSILKDIPYSEVIIDGKIYFEVQRDDGTFILVYSTYQALLQRNTQILRNYGVRSKYEFDFMKQLENLGIEFEYEYTDELYPYACDFYLPKFKAYIELHTGPQHGYCFYKGQDTELNKEEWNYTWKVKDVEKLKCAKENNLNYIVLFNKEDIQNYLERLKNENK